jgi:YggT family protein
VFVITLLQIIEYLIGVIQLVVFVMFVMSLLISFNVVNMHNDFVAALWRAVNAILDPLLNPIRRIMPNTGAIDFSPMVLLIILYIVGNIVIPNLIAANAF